MSRIWKADGEEKPSDILVSDPSSASSAQGHQTLLKGQTLIGTDGRLQKANTALGKLLYVMMHLAAKRCLLLSLKQIKSYTSLRSCDSLVFFCNICVLRLCSGSYSVLCVSEGFWVEAALRAVWAVCVSCVHPAMLQLLQSLLQLMCRYRVSEWMTRVCSDGSDARVVLIRI